MLPVLTAILAVLSGLMCVPLGLLTYVFEGYEASIGGMGILAVPGDFPAFAAAWSALRRPHSRAAAWLLVAATVLSLDLVMMPPLPTLVLGAAVVSGFLQAREA